MKIRTALATIALMLSGSAIAPAQSPAPANPPPRPECGALRAGGPMHFWVGKWDAKIQGQSIGVNDITAEAGGCAVAEHWTDKTSTGTSLTYYDAGDKAWHQLYVGSGSAVYAYTGSADAKELHMTGTIATPKGTVQSHLIVEQIDADTVRQRIDTSTDGGKTFKSVFDALYHRIHERIGLRRIVGHPHKR